MILNRLGTTDFNLSLIGLGCWQMSKQTGFAGKFWPELTDELTLDIVKSSLDGGVNWFDTAELYGWGKSEKSLALSLSNLEVNDEKVFIATKWWPLFRFSKSIRQTIHTRLKKLGGYSISLHQVHMPYGFSSIEQEMNMMADLVEEGYIKHIGVSNFNKTQMLRAYEALDKRNIKLTSNQIEYSILNRKIESNGILEMANKLDVSIIAYSPLAQGIVSGKFHDNPSLINYRVGWRKYKSQFNKVNMMKSQPIISALQNIANKYNITPSQVALNWLIYFNNKKVFVIPGATSSQQIRENVNSIKYNLTTYEIDQLDELSKVYL